MANVLVFAPVARGIAIGIGVLGLLPLADLVIRNFAFVRVDETEVRELDYVVPRRCARSEVEALRMELWRGGRRGASIVLNLVDAGGRSLLSISASIYPYVGIARVARRLAKPIGGPAAHMWLLDALLRRRSPESKGDLALEGGQDGLIRRLEAERQSGTLELTGGATPDFLYFARGRIIRESGAEEGRPLPSQLAPNHTRFAFRPCALPESEIELIAGCVDESCYRPPL